ncbi:MAG: hypothetical protein HRU19_05245 [Pseudobacteriovorax sp.]|nr:hypothetical protein [Pseudobacteriovorax sp.]
MLNSKYLPFLCLLALSCSVKKQDSNLLNDEKETTINVQAIKKIDSAVHGLAPIDGVSYLVSDTYSPIVQDRIVEIVPESNIRLSVNNFIQQPGGILNQQGLITTTDIGRNLIQSVQNETIVDSWDVFVPWNVIAYDSNRLLATYGLSNGGIALLQPGGQAQIFISGLQNPFDLARDSRGNIWVSEQGLNGQSPGRVTQYNVNGEILQRITEVVFQNPEGIALDGSDNLYVADTGASIVYAFNPEGGLIAQTEANFVHLPIMMTNDIDGSIIGTGVFEGNNQVLRYSLVTDSETKESD